MAGRIPDKKVASGIIREVRMDEAGNASCNGSDDALSEAAGIIRRGGVVVFPTRSLYGLAADALNPEAVERVFNIKRRVSTNPLLVLVDELNQLEGLVRGSDGNASPNLSSQKSGYYCHPERERTGIKNIISDRADAIIRKFWPGRVTIVFDAAPGLPKALTAGTGKIGIRMAGHPVAKALVKKVGRAVTGTSANISGQPGCMKISDLDQEIIDSVDMILDGGTLKGGTGSTVVDITSDPVKIVREGAVTTDEILKAISGF